MSAAPHGEALRHIESVNLSTEAEERGDIFFNLTWVTSLGMGFLRFRPKLDRSVNLNSRVTLHLSGTWTVLAADCLPKLWNILIE